jgi:hypothetical protein
VAISGSDAVDLRPSASTPVANPFRPLGGILPGAWTAARIVEIETSPSGATLDLFYLRRNLQQRFERAESPVRIVLPAPLETSRHDAVLIRAGIDGYQVGEALFDSRKIERRVTIDLEPLPNRLERFSHRGLSGRTTLLFATREVGPFRLLSEAGGFRVVLASTALEPEVEAMFGDVKSALIERIEAFQLGDDLVVRVALREEARISGETRGRRWRDPSRDLRGFAIDLVVPQEGEGRAMRLRDALNRVTSRDVTGCALAWERALRTDLSPDVLAGALTASSIDDAFLHQAMRRLGALSHDGVVRTVDGREYRVSKEIEALAATSLASEIVGYLALLRGAVDALESPPYRAEALRGLIAPEVTADSWQAHLRRAKRAGGHCEESMAAG